MPQLESLVFIILILLSGYLSASEVALFSLSKFQLRILKDRLRPSYRAIKRLLADPGGLLITILVSNEIINISIATIVSDWFSHAMPDGLHTAFGTIPAWAAQTALGIAVTTPVVLLFCEMTPKVIGARANQMIAPLTAPPLCWLYDGFKPVRFVLKRVMGLVSSLLGKQAHKHPSGDSELLLKEEEFLFMAEEGLKEGAIQKNELEMMRNIFELDDRTVADIYTPLTQVQSLPFNTPVTTAISTMRGARYSRIPVTDADRKKVLGILYTKDLLFSKIDPQITQHEIGTLMRKPLTVSPSMRLNDFFRLLKQNNSHMAVITVGGQSGEAMGIVTMADLLDAIFEEVLANDA